ncbi:hypothetical protein Btru_047351 [Bulinus truncatus]|nr:hypothetical protein Btru_047351 [Bulinus truncatus]
MILGTFLPHRLPPAKYWMIAVLLVASSFTNGALAVFTACGGNLTEQAGVILSPNFPNNYPNYATCYWNITVAPNQIIDFRFKRLDLDRYSDQSCNDWVSLYDGPGTQYPVIPEYYWLRNYDYQCGSANESRTLNMIFRSTSNHMYVRFYSDSQNTRTGFSASYWALECPPFKYGKEVCNNTCVCNQNNTLYCVNHNGTCVCKSGWTSVDCTVDVDECQDPNRCEDPYSQCVNTPGSFVCQCKPGMIKNDRGLCEDAQVCTQKKCSHACAVTSASPQTETCYCPKGMKLDPANNSTCIECNNWTYGENCSFVSKCHTSNTKSYNKTNGLCSCFLHFTGSTCTEDVNECWPKSPCNVATNHANCVNFYGGFECRCLLGYEKRNDTDCDDSYYETRPAYIEIYDGGSNSSKLLAIFYGTPAYSAPSGIIRSSSNQMFIILYTGYYNGNSGYSSALSAAFWTHECQPFTFGSNCTLPCICITSNTQYCNSTNGQCVCKNGWSGANCSVDINECLDNPLACPDYSICQNTIGSFECKCKEGLNMTADKCDGCKNNQYGPDCSRNCDCVQNNTLSCDTKTGKCTCLPLWKGKNCSTDYDVCTPYSTNECQKYANCTNTGALGYRCRCSQNDGYIESANKSCVPISCRTFTYGTDSCDKVCKCVKENTDFCDNVNGECICKPGWTLGDCSTDVNECLGTNNKVCPTNSDCNNTKGSYRCECHRGYKFNVTTGTCDVSNECLYKQCSHTCYVVGLGVEKCACPEGLILDTLTDSVCVIPYYPYGKNVTDQVLSDSYKSYNTIFVSSPLYFSYGAPYGHDIHPAAFILSNGVIGFGSRVISFGGYQNLIYANDKKLNILAPFMTNINPFKGQVFYHLYEKCAVKLSSDDSHRSSVMDAIIARAEKDIREYNHISDFEVSTVLVVTWAGVQPYGIDKQTELNTFQALYISGWEQDNGQVAETAYVIFLYQYGLMNWNFLPGRPISIGTSGAFTNVLQDLDTTLVDVLDSVPGNTGYKGVMSFKVGHLTGPQQSCKKYLCDHASLLNDPVYQYEKDNLYKCPCTLERLGAQWQLFERRGPNQDIYCYAISMVAKQRLLRDNKRNMLCCYRWIQPSSDDDWRVWLQSWRDATYLPKSPESGHVLVNDPWYLGYFNNYQALENIRTHGSCCRESGSAQLCDQFYQIFPDYECSNFVEFVPRWALGDPHFITLDGLTYTMNGLGEYIMLENPSENFTLQTRTGQAEASNGTLINATVFIAFAAKESNKSSFQVELSSSKTSLILMANDIDITNDFYKENGPDIIVSTTTINVIREYRNNKTLAIVTFPCGASITVHVAIKSLFIEVEVPKSFRNKTMGLLGNFNEDKNDEFILPDGTVLPTNLTERQIYQQFAPKWSVTSKNSVFIYRPGESTNTYQHPEFIPKFGDEINLSQSKEAVSICGDKNSACKFDYLVTGDKEFAQNTKDQSEEMEVVIQNLDNSPPTIKIMNGSLDKSGRWLVKQGQTSVLKIIAHDEDNDSVTFELANNVTGISINQTGHIRFTPDLTKPIMLRIRAKDAKGSYSPLFAPCAMEKVYVIMKVPSLKNMKMVGFKYSLAIAFLLTQSELNACEVNPCFAGQNCTDLTAEQQGNNPVGYSCGPCPIGYTEWNGTCLDIDECNNTKICDGSCTNTEGSYICTCPAGYRLDLTDRKSCKDINECEERTSRCEQKCINNKGSYTCSCYSDYTLDTNGQTCTLDPSKQVSCYVCQQVCQTTASSQVNCSCRIGYEVDPKDKTNCIDLDECQSGNKPCSHVCVNSLGSYQCSCYSGYKLAADRISCEACKSPYYGENCGNICQCNNRGTCDPVRGCVCNRQWTGVNCEIDVNECTQPDVCPSGYVCENTIGSYKCQCPTGYKLENGVCQDINECSEASNLTCNVSFEVCENTLGSYSCLCQPGYARHENICQDINECTSNVNDCEQNCVNKPGTYNCQCYTGYMLNDDRKTCSKKGLEECVVQNMNCSYGCRKDSNNTAVCFCPQGYNVNKLGQCEDINECITDVLNLCTNKNGCTNTNGSYTCTCQTGSKLDNDGRTCIACSGETWGLECANSCSCGLGSDRCDPKTGCICKAGFTGILCDQDIDECKSGVLRCTAKEKCINTPGSASCVCLDGYKKVNGECQDLNECSNTTLNNCTQVCNNLEGSFTCSCYSGYLFNADKTCTDLDECKLGTSKCEGLCINTEGSYRCSCRDGLVLQPDGFKCAVSVPCMNRTDCSYQCAKINGTEICLCPKGKVLNSNGIACDDLDLCASSPCTFGCVETKDNTSFECMCKTGQVLSADKVTCTDCTEGRWGVACNNTCQCLTTNTKYCDKVNGRCLCKAGWNGTLCDQDIDECLNTSICPTHTKCRNTDGEYLCACVDGYITTNTVNETCKECDEGYFGPSCSIKCSCSLNSNCNKTNGLCYCKAGWNGTNCDLDINECDAGTHKCNVTKHERCENAQGSYECVCSSGYARKCSSCECEDIDECNSTQTNKCEQNCENLSGGYKCSCSSGYTVSSTETMKCEDIDECHDPMNSPCDHNCSYLVGSYKCSCRESFVINPLNISQCTKVVQLNANVTFDMNVAGINLEDVNSTDCKRLKTDIENQLVKKLKEKKLSVVSVTVTKLRRGSLISEIIVVMNAENAEITLTTALQELLAVKFDLNNTTVLMISVFMQGNAVEPRTCEVRQIIKPCLETEECIGDNGVTACQKKQNDNTRLILGLAIGIPLFILLCVVIAGTVYCCTKKKKVSEGSYNENLQNNRIENMHAVQNPYLINANYQGKQDTKEEFPYSDVSKE